MVVPQDRIDLCTKKHRRMNLVCRNIWRTTYVLWGLWRTQSVCRPGQHLRSFMAVKQDQPTHDAPFELDSSAARRASI